MKEDEGKKRMRFILLILVAATADAQNYAVHLQPPEHAGQIYAVSTTGSKLDHTSMGDRVIKTTEYQVNFKGRAEVLKVDSSRLI